MTFHNLAPDGLPYVEAGMIWDGVTEFHNDQPPGVATVFLLRMYADGSRRFSEFVGSTRPASHFPSQTERGWEQIGVTFTSPTNPIDYRIGDAFLAYDGSLTFDPVNHLTYLNPFKAHAARYAQQLNATLNFDVLASADAADRLIVKQTLSAMLGSAARRYAQWEAIDPEELIVGGEFDGTPLWQHHDRVTQDYIDIDTALCGECELDLYAQEFYFEADLPAFGYVWRNGVIYVPDHSTTPWSPTLFDAAPGLVGDFHDELDEHYRKMLRHYAQVVAVQDRGHVAVMTAAPTPAESATPAKTVGVMTDNDGNPSAGRWLAMIALLFACGLGANHVAMLWYGKEVDITIVLYFLIAAFGGKVGQKLIEVLPKKA